MSGVAAVSIRGETLHSAAALCRKVKDDDYTWTNARLLIIDEVSFMSTLAVDKLDSKLRKLTKNHTSTYGGLNVLFCGDFMQLEPVKGNPLYSREYEDRLWSNSINSYIELKGLHRFKDDREWGEILGRFCKNIHTPDDIAEVNKRVMGSDTKENKSPPNNSSYCVYSNADRSAINTGIFFKTLQANESEITGREGENI